MLLELDDSTIDTQRKWLLFMLERVGHNNLLQLLDYYEGIGWINENVLNKLLELAKNEKRHTGPSWTLSPEEHRKSFLFIEKIRGGHVDESLLKSEMGRARLGTGAPERTKTRAGYIESQQAKDRQMDVTIHRREITIKNLEQELDAKNAEIEMLRKRLFDIEGKLAECQSELMKNLIFRDIFSENTRLKKAGVSSRARNLPNFF